jgi:hypothetical protein
MISKTALLATTILFALSARSATARQAGVCHNIGDAITIRGHIVPGVNGGTYFELLNPLCVHYPKKTDQFKPTNVETIGNKLPPSIYLEITGRIRDPWPLMGIGVQVTAYKDVDAEVKASLGDWKRRCEQWQDEKIPALNARTHGGQVERIFNYGQDPRPGNTCGVSAADTKLPHEVITIWRPES